jgi:hypothetical protein
MADSKKPVELEEGWKDMQVISAAAMERALV